MTLTAVDTDQPSGHVVLMCLHCDNGKVNVEDHATVENNFTVVVPASLKRNEMTPAEKREHLRGLGMKSGEDIEKIIHEIYFVSVTLEERGSPDGSRRVE
jgi:hypothetical protein